MEYRIFGRTGLRVSAIGLGTGGASMLGQAYGHSIEDATRHVRRALDLGINYIDTAAGYKDSEAMLGQALAGVARDSYILSTKFWPERNGVYASAEDVAASIDRSLQKLQTDFVDIFYLHGVSPAAYPRSVELYSATLEKARADGKVKFLGMSEQYGSDYHHEMVQLMAQNPLFDAAMIGYNVVGPAAAIKALPAMKEQNVGVAIMCAIRKVIARPEELTTLIDSWKAEGILAADAVPSDAPLDWLLGNGCDAVADAAYKFAAAHPAVSTVLTGTANTHHLEQNVAAVLGPGLRPELVKRAMDVFAPIARNI
ncbi:MAG: aldo/keto reductase [Chloroflexota bacterium]